MSRIRNDPHRAKLRRERIRRGKAGPPPPSGMKPIPPLTHPFASERSMREIQALMEGRKFNSADEINARLAELTEGGRISEMANTWKQDDPKWRAQELAYDALETDDIKEALWLVSEALKLDPDCTDANRLMVALLPVEPGNRVRLMREVVEKAERNLGKSFFEENTGHFWGTIATRPYMRAKQHLGELLAGAGEREEAAGIFERMLELNPNDNQGMRYPLVGLYLFANQPAAAASVMARYPDEERIMGSFAWGRVMERWLSGELVEAEAALERARKVNPFVEKYILGTRKAPDQAPEYYRRGDETEAQVCAKELGGAWQRHPAFREWLRSRGT